MDKKSQIKNMAPFSSNEYCLNPKVFQSLPLSSRTYYDKICRLRKKLKAEQPNWTDSAQELTDEAENMIHSIISPHGLEILGLFMGISLTSKAALNGILRGIAKGIGPEVLALATQQAEKEGALFINNAILTTVLAAAVEEGTVSAMAFAITSAVASSTSVILSVVMIVQFLGVIVDMWDPEGYSHELNAETLQIITDEFDSLFVSKMLNTVAVGKDRYGRTVHYESWPIEFTLDHNLTESLTTMDLFPHVFRYLRHLSYNSNGEKMFPRRKDGSMIIAPHKFKTYSDSLAIALSDENTVVAKWFRNNILSISILIATILYVLFKY